jgi:hypothetical protein
MLWDGNLNEFLEVLVFYIQLNAYQYFSKEYSSNDMLQQVMYKVAVLLTFLENSLTVHELKDLTF